MFHVVLLLPNRVAAAFAISDEVLFLGLPQSSLNTSNLPQTLKTL